MTLHGMRPAYALIFVASLLLIGCTDAISNHARAAVREKSLGFQDFSSGRSVTIPAPDWTENAPVPLGGRENIFNLSAVDLKSSVRKGLLESLHYPVDVTGILLPLRPLSAFFESDPDHPLRQLIATIWEQVSDLHRFSDLEQWLGLHPYPDQEGDGVYYVPFKDGIRPEHAMGLTIMETPKGAGFTISCAQCHSGQLFGKTILGLTNRFPRANQLFDKGIQASHVVGGRLFQWSTGATDDETSMFTSSMGAAQFVGPKSPTQLGLDTSLAQVALSLARRAPDEFASKVLPIDERPDPLARSVSDSKPAVWWNLKFKNRWLSDGSVVSGNPIFTNLIWNEIGRGTDLKTLAKWMIENEPKIHDLTAAVFAAQAPRFTDFFAAETLQINAVKHGESLFNQNCAGCHGTYEKKWSERGAAGLPLQIQFETTFVRYHANTPVVDVGTDPLRYLGMRSLERLNELAISKANGVIIRPQVGYVPPPLVGIWARWPYFHNNSVPSLCAVLTPAKNRPTVYWAREATDKTRDFDRECNGYPSSAPETDSPEDVVRNGSPTLAPTSAAELLYDTSRTGLSNSGHDDGILLDENGSEIFSSGDKKDLIQFLQTL